MAATRFVIWRLGAILWRSLISVFEPLSRSRSALGALRFPLLPIQSFLARCFAVALPRILLGTRPIEFAAPHVPFRLLSLRFGNACGQEADLVFLGRQFIELRFWLPLAPAHGEAERAESRSAAVVQNRRQSHQHIASK